MFSFIKNTFKKIYSTITSQLANLFASHHVDAATLQKLERILLEADTGVTTTRHLIKELEVEMAKGFIQTGGQLKEALRKKLLDAMHMKEFFPQGNVYLFVGINGSGKTTTVAKMAYYFKQEGKRVLVAAADTFRAAAVQQLQQWTDKIGVDIVITSSTDPAAVLYAACQKYKNEQYDILLIDTAGRLQTKSNLMKELEKMGNVVLKQLPQEKLITLLTIDSMLGQNSLDQARLFHESTKLHGIILTKMDGTAKGGIVFAIMQELQVPVAYVTFGEQLDQIKPFNAVEFVDELLNA
jgi:fused signal recognition particle receptor